MLECGTENIETYTPRKELRIREVGYMNKVIIISLQREIKSTVINFRFIISKVRFKINRKHQ